MAAKQYRLVKNLMIPAGTLVSVTPAGSTRMFAVAHASIVGDTHADKNSSWDWDMDLDEALRVGLIEQIGG